MSWSFSEIKALAAAAARGAGALPGQAARFGEAAAMFLSGGNPPDALASALAALPGGAILDLPLALDQALTSPDGVLPISCVDADGRDLLESYVAVLPFEAKLVRDGDAMRLDVDAARPKAARQVGRIEGCADFIAEMTRLAARIHVPDSDSSRLSGAGAGLTDND